MDENSKQTVSCDNLNNTLERKLSILQSSCRDNAEYFANDHSENGQRLHSAFTSVTEVIPSLEPKLRNIQKAAQKFDFDPNVQGNGYRSYISVLEAAVGHTNDLSEKVKQKRDSLLFRKTSIVKDVESLSQILTSLDVCFKHLELLLSWSHGDSLFPDEEHSPEELLNYTEVINQYCFYGRNIGFQFCESLRNVLKFILLSMVIFSEAYYSTGSILSKATNSVVTTTKYLTDPELRAKRIVNVTMNSDVDFCKSFWFLSESEFMHQMPSVVSSTVAVSKIINLPAEVLKFRIDGREIEVPPPEAHIGRKTLQVRLISHTVREGMIGEGTDKIKGDAPSPGLVIHCHGGGFVAQSSRSHEIYLRDWAKHLDVPILSIDYSLAPEAPFPRALEEITYVFCWASQNSHLLGSSGTSIVAAGDSAGANLIVAACLKCLSLGVPTPNGLFLAYFPVFVDFIPSPSRFLCMMDPLLPLGFLLRCLKAYALPDLDKINAGSSSDSFDELTESDLQELQAHKSPVSEASDTLTFCSNLNDEDGDKYVSDFLEKYALDSDTDTEATRMTSSCKSSSSRCENSIHERVANFMFDLKQRIGGLMGGNAVINDNITKERILGDGSKLREEFRFTIPRDPLLSPILASDEQLSQLPTIKILSTEMDPCLDDCVMFGKKLKSLNKNVSLDVLKELPHGFLNFSMLSKEAHQGSMLCVERIRELLNSSDA